MKNLLIAAVAVAGTAQAQDTLLIVDLTVVDEITITSTAGLSAASVSGSDGIGFLLADFFNGGAGPGLFSTGTGDLTPAANTSDGSPVLFNFSSSVGLNVFSFTDDPDAIWNAGDQAFSGSATFSVDPAAYAAALAGNSSGTIFAIADSDDDIAGASALGSWALIPAPSTAALLGLGGLAAARRRR
ncbi:MAG: PEP-CTERM sorting domain-containing protein [Planctomycetota bacterium]